MPAEKKKPKNSRYSHMVSTIDVLGQSAPQKMPDQSGVRTVVPQKIDTEPVRRTKIASITHIEKRKDSASKAMDRLANRSKRFKNMLSPRTHAITTNQS